MRTLAPQGGVTRPEDTQKGAPPPPHPEIFLGTHLPSSPFESSAASRTESWAESSPPSCSGPWGQMGREAGSPWRESPQVRHQSALQTNLDPSIEPALDLGPPRECGYQKPSASVHKAEHEPLDRVPVPSKRTVARMVHDVATVWGSISPPLHLPGYPVGRQAFSLHLPDAGFRSTRAPEVFSLRTPIQHPAARPARAG